MVTTSRRVAGSMARRSDVAIATVMMASCFAFAVFHCVQIGQHDWVQHTSPRAVALSMFPPASLQEGREGVALLRHEPVKVEVTDSSVTISNGYVRAVFDRAAPSLKYLAGDFSGTSAYGANTLAEEGITLDRLDKDGQVKSSASSGQGPSVEVEVLSQTGDLGKVKVGGIVDDRSSPLVQETWVLTLKRGSRSLHLEAQGTMLAQSAGIKVVRPLRMRPTSIYGLYEEGTEQMKAGKKGGEYYVSTDSLPWVYSLGGWGDDDYPMAGNLCLAIHRDVYPANGLHVLKAAKEGPTHTALIELLAGGEGDMPNVDMWSGDGWMQTPESVVVAKGQTWASSLHLYPNNYDFPVINMTTQANLPIEDLAPMMTGIYGTAVGALRNRVNSIVRGKKLQLLATSLRYPVAAYSTGFNFFDPDNYFTVRSVLIGGNSNLNNQVRKALEATGSFLSEQGQIPHHFEQENPTYRAISGEVQPGPNIFWVLSCFHYAKMTQDLDWLRGYMPTIRRATSFIFNMINEETGLARVPGALMIDVFLRSDYATDTNAMLVAFFSDFADAEEAVGDMQEAKRLRELSAKVGRSVDKLLWSEEEGDHYVTQLRLDGSKRDMVDYDANFIALAHGIASPERAAKVFKRVDAGHLTHVAPTYVSERYYGRSETTLGNTGDSACTMGRIAWFDALARRRYGDLETFNNVLVNPLRDDLRNWTWMHERYGTDGLPSLNRTNYYHEYPSVVSVMLRELRYGIQIGYQSVEINPFGPSEYSYDVGNVQVRFSKDALSIKVPVYRNGGTVKMHYTITQLHPGTGYGVYSSGCNGEVTKAAEQVVKADELGVLQFDASARVGEQLCTVQVRAIGSRGRDSTSTT